MTSGSESEGVPGKPPTLPQPRLWVCFAFQAGCWLALLGLSHALQRPGFPELARTVGFQAVAAVLLASLGAAVWVYRRWLFRTVTSLPFSAAQIASLLVFTAIGTVILQQAAPEAYAERHGKAMAAALLALGMDDIFHAPWFTGLLALQGVTLVLTAIGKRAWRPQLWGHMLSHLGFVTVMIGGWIGGHYGFKGQIDIHEGQVVHEASLMGKGGVRGDDRPLGFGVKLEKFAVENYKPEAKFYVYEGMRGIRAFAISEAGSERPIGSSGATFHVVKAYPDFYQQPEVRDVAAGAGGGPVLEIDFKQGDWSARSALVAGVAGKDATPLSRQGPALRFVWSTPSDAEIAQFALDVPPSHLVTLQPQTGEGEAAAVAIGKAGILPIAGYEITPDDFLPDFSFDSQTKKAFTRTQEPNNPALHVRIRNTRTGETSARWLFAKMPDFGHTPGETAGPKFVYRYQPGRRPDDRGLLAVGEAQQLWRLDHGKVVERLPLEQWQTACTGLPVAAMRLHPSAVVAQVAGTRSEEWKRPVADIVLSEGGERREIRLAAEHAQQVSLADGKTSLAFELRNEQPKTFRSHLSIIEDGRTVAEKTIVVNDPLTWKGCMFYQSNFRKDDPTYSGIMVVNDPGLGVVFAGFIMMSLGVIFVYYIRPRLLAGETHGH